MKFKENREKATTNQEKYTLKLMKVLRAASLGSNFTSFRKKECSALCQNKFLLISFIEYSDISLSYSVTHQSH